MGHPRKELEAIDTFAKKSFSQNFLKSPHWIEKLTNSVLEGEGEVWEIGPGLGALTEKLIEKYQGRLVLFEFDRKLAKRLSHLAPSVEVREGDFLKAELTPLWPDTAKVRLLSNLPYHISSPVLFKLLPERERFSHWVFTFQKEFADRLMAEPKTKAYGALSVMVQEFFQMQNLGLIPPQAFYPAPAVYSTVIRFFPKVSPRVTAENLRRVVRSAFQHRRKKMLSNLLLDFPKEEVRAAFDAMKLDENARAETLSPAQFAELTQRLFCVKRS